MKRITSFALALLLCMSLCIPAIAADAHYNLRNDCQVMAVVPEIKPQAVTVLQDIKVNFVDGYSTKVKPDKGTNLKFVGSAIDDDVTLKVYKNGGWWASKTVTLYDGAGAKTYDLITNCNGEEYELVFTADNPATVIGYACQSQYT